MENTLSFIRELALNNDRDWFNDNRQRWKACQEEIHIFTSELIDRLSACDPSLKGLRVADCLWRINRDIRFSRDKSPYKSWIGIFLSPGGKKSGNAGYYFHIEGLPDGDCPNMLYAGIHLPAPKILSGIRREICRSHEAFTDCINAAEGFALDTSSSLKRNPAGFPKGSPREDLLRLKDDIGVIRKVSDDFITAPDAPARVADAFSRATPFVRLVNATVLDILTEGEYK